MAEMKVTFITGHNWDTKRHGGFHKFAEFCALNDHETVFFSFPRPYYSFFMHREQMNSHVLLKLAKGMTYDLGNSGKEILNVTYPTFRLPDGITKRLPEKLTLWLATHGLVPFSFFAKKFLCNTDVFVFESNECVYLMKKIRGLFPESKVIYRPSDPMVFGSVPSRLKNAEKEMLLNADLNLIVNMEGLEAYRKSIPDFENKAKFELLSNGVDIESYTKSYPIPEELKKNNTILYVGAWEVEWPLLFRGARENPDQNYIVVCPNYPAEEIKKQLGNYENLTYVPGIKPDQVPAWITNCSVVMVPYVTDFYKDRPLGITAKYYQAMAAGKPIVAYHDTPKLKDAGVAVTYSYDDFLYEIRRALENKKRNYSFDITGRDWNVICTKFMEFIAKKS